MQVLKINIVLIVALLAISVNARALSYECEFNGETRIQSQPCPGVVYPENVTAQPRYAGTKMTLSEALASGGEAKESIGNRSADSARYKQRSRGKARSGRWP